MAVKNADGSFSLDFARPLSVGKVGPYAGAFLAIVRAYAYIRHYGREMLHEISENAVLHANYMRVELGQDLPGDVRQNHDARSDLHPRRV